jgi:hypothetical protein
MRYRVTVPYVTRVAAEDDVIPLTTPVVGKDGKLINEIFVPKGTPVDGGLVSSLDSEKPLIYESSHFLQGDYNQSKLIWGEDAEVFNPNRWLDPKGPLKTKDVADGTWGGGLITFITGPRTCLGFRVAVLEMQMFLTEMVARYKVSTIIYKPKHALKSNAGICSSRD